ncbi:MAG: helix-turn-helix domain-containing protein [Rubrivivax sp.]|nr:helix-turn-helix domain-containing protein [Rubrivivax sp.]
MRATAPAVAFREVRHFRPDDWLHWEPIAVRGEAMDWTIPAHRHEGLHQIHWLSSGQARVELDGVPHLVQAPAVLMIAPGCVHAFQYERASTGQQVTVPTARLVRALAAAPTLTAMLTSTCLLQGEPVSADAARLQALCAALAEEFSGSEPGRNEALQAHLVLLVTWILRRAAPASIAENRRALRDTLVQRYRALIELHLRRHQPLGFYAAQLQVTADHLSRNCRAACGLSALDLLHDRLLLEARRLLAYSAAPVTEVARDLGFDDSSYFSRFFARRAGQAPLDYRAALQTGLAAPP